MARKILPSIIRLEYLSPFTWLFFIGYILLLLFFNKIDVYHHYFFSTGFIVFSYNIFRLFFIFCLMWLCYIAGDYTLSLLTKHTDHREIKLEPILLTFFAGLSIGHIVLLFIGFAGLYTRTLMAVITLALFAISLPRFNQWVRFFQTHRKPIYWPGFLLFLLPTLFFLMTKGLYPSGGHDYFTHYFPYYREVIESGSILPGRLWYHFYYDKGMGLFFLSMLITDPLAPQLVTTAMIFASSGIIFSLIRQSTSWRLLPWIGVALYISFLIYTPGSISAMRETGWGEIEKSHEPATILMFFIIWVTINLAQTTQFRLWGILLILTASTLTIMSMAMAAFAGIYLMTILLCFLLYKQYKPALIIACGLFAIGFWLTFLLLVNYLLTGLPDEQSALFWWPYVNFSKVNEWGGLFQVINLYYNRIDQLNDKLAFTPELIKKIVTYLRLDLWGPLLSMIVFGSLFSLKQKRWRLAAKSTRMALYACGGFLLLIACLSFIIGRDQPTSFYRFTSFTYAPALSFCLLLLAVFLSDRKKWAAGILVLGFLSALSVIRSHHPTHIFSFNNKNLFHIVENSGRFAIGTYSIADAYRHQDGRPGAEPWGAIYPPLETIWHQLPLKTRIWSWHVHNYCMLPDCDIEEYYSFQMSPHEGELYFGDPQKAKKQLQKENLNYFFFSDQLDIRDRLHLSPLFSPEHIADYLGIAWTDGHNTLLTWKEQAHSPIDALWIRRYSEANKSIDTNRIRKIKKILSTVDEKFLNRDLRLVISNADRLK